MIPETVLAYFRNSNCVITGGTGMIGRQVAIMLVEAGANVKVISLDDVKVHDSIDHVYGDLTDFNFCLEQTKGMDHVFHIAGIKGSVDVTTKRPASFFVPLIMFNTNVLEASRRNNVHSLVYTSSIGAYSDSEIFVEDYSDVQGNPMDQYPGWAKRMAELQVKAYETEYGLSNFSIVRPCNVYGPGDNFDPENAMVIPSLMARIAGGENPLKVWGDGSAIRDFAFSRDIAEGVILSLYHSNGSKYLNLGSGVGTSIRDLIEALREVTPFEFEFDTTKSGGFPRRVMDIRNAQANIGYNPSTSLVDGLTETWEWFLANRDESQKKKNYFRKD